jgi:dethiobiotin synthetase
MTPAETGLTDSDRPGPSARLLKWAARSAQAEDEIGPNRFSARLDPAQAASEAGRKIDFNELVRSARKLVDENDFTLIDASGGLMVPLAGGLLTADFANMVGLPVVVVSAPRPGAVNHTLMSLYSARQLGLDLAGYLLNNSSPAEGRQLSHTLAVMTVDELLGVMPQVAGDERQKAAQLAQEIVAMKTFPLLAPYFPPLG